MFTLFQVRAGYMKIVQERYGYVGSVPFISVFVRVVQVVSSCMVMTRYIRLFSG
jgi:hypothetical protein